MDLDRIAQAFAAGFTVGRAMAMDAARDGEEDGHWVTIGAEAGPDGEKHGGRPVFIKGAKKKGATNSDKNTTGHKDPYDVTFNEFLGKIADGKAAEFDKYGDFDLLNKCFEKAGSSGVSKRQMIDRLNRAYRNIPNDYKYLTQKALTFVSYKEFNPEHGAYYEFGSNQISLDLEELTSRSELGPAQYPARDPFLTFIHEVAHATDMNTGFSAEDRFERTIGANPEFREAVEKDIGTLVAKLREEARQKLETGPTSDDFKKMPPDGQEFMINMKAGHILEDAGNSKSMIYLGISDMVSGYTNDAISGGGHHEKSYWENDPLNKYREIFAHVYEAHMYPEYLEEFRSLFPNLVQTTDKLMRNAAKMARDDYAKKMERIRQREERRKARIDRAE